MSKPEFRRFVGDRSEPITGAALRGMFTQHDRPVIVPRQDLERMPVEQREAQGILPVDRVIAAVGELPPGIERAEEVVNGRIVIKKKGAV
jgi:hypothetical protein